MFCDETGMIWKGRCWEAICYRQCPQGRDWTIRILTWLSFPYWLPCMKRQERASQWGRSVPRPTSMTRSQIVWLTLGVLTLVLVAFVAALNVREIYNSQKDFVVGTLF